MYQIGKVKIEGVRGFVGEHELNEKTIICGPNGAGKTAIVAGIHLALSGKVPGYGAGDAFKNCAGNSMSCAVEIKTLDKIDHAVSRAWASTGKTIRQSVVVDGEKANKTVATGMLRQMFGGRLPIVDMAAFWAARGEMRLGFLLAAVDAADLDQATVAERNSSELVSSLAAELSAKKKSLADLTGRLSGSDAVGDGAAIQLEMEEIEGALKEVRERLAKGRENEAVARRGAEEQQRIAKCEARKQPLLDDFESATAELDRSEKALADHASREPEKEKETLPDSALDILRETANIIDEVIEALHERSATDAYEEDADIEAVVKRLSALSRDLTESLVVKPNKGSARNEWREQGRLLLADAQRHKALCDNLGSQLEQLSKTIAEFQQGAFGEVQPGPDARDIAEERGLEARLRSLSESLRPVIERETLERQAEKLRIEIGQAKTTIERAKKEQGEAKDVLLSILGTLKGPESVLAERSRRILPVGYAETVTDGRTASLAWVFPDRGTVPAEGLSGGERVVFDAAVGHSLNEAAAVVVEAAEVDNWPGVHTLAAVLWRLSEAPCQVIVLTCHAYVEELGEMVKGWKVIELGQKIDASRWA